MQNIDRMDRSLPRKGGEPQQLPISDRGPGRTRVAHALIVATLLSLLGSTTSCGPDDCERGTRPNILLIVADDMGYSDLGAYGGEISTPNLDAFARSAALFTQFHVAPNCGPTRGTLLTGVDSHRAGLGANSGTAAENQRGLPAYQGFLRDDVVTMGELLQDSGYRTYMVGKWHLGHEPHNLPSGRGFDRSFALVNGGASHWPDATPLIPGSATVYMEDGNPVAELPKDFYSTRTYTDRMIEFITADTDDDAPFLAYLAYTAPHNPLHVPMEYREKYRDAFDRGWDVVAGQRARRVHELGLFPASIAPQPRPEWLLAWDALTPEQRASRARDMEVYAGMIDYLDESIQRVFDALRESGDYDDTLIVFLSDNGPSRTTILDYVALGGEAAAFFEQFDNSAANLGLPGSSPDIGPGWAFASATPLRLSKGYVSQGGIQVPAIVKLPGAAGRPTVIRTPAHVMDILPTFLEAAAVSHPKTHNGMEVTALQGLSLMPLLRGESDTAFNERGLGWEAYGMDAYRRGPLKILRLPEPYGNGAWQLYDLDADPGEANDRASEHPRLVEELARAWERYAGENGIVRPVEPVAYGRPISAGRF
jgi:arylsulfatase